MTVGLDAMKSPGALTFSMSVSLPDIKLIKHWIKLMSDLVFVGLNDQESLRISHSCRA